jgi:predicted RNA-binding Zn ribbon-like protein
VTDDELLLALLNSTPVEQGVRTDALAETDAGCAWLAGRGGIGSLIELRVTRTARDLLQAIVRGEARVADVGLLLRGVRQEPVATADGLTWEVLAPEYRLLAVRAALAWAALHETSPGRLRPCANEECRLFLLDRSKANTARWCSMARCGNRLKARRHYIRWQELEASR